MLSCDSFCFLLKSDIVMVVINLLNLQVALFISKMHLLFDQR